MGTDLRESTRICENPQSSNTDILKRRSQRNLNCAYMLDDGYDPDKMKLLCFFAYLVAAVAGYSYVARMKEHLHAKTLRSGYIVGSVLCFIALICLISLLSASDLRAG